MIFLIECFIVSHLNYSYAVSLGQVQPVYEFVYF